MKPSIEIPKEYVSYTVNTKKIIILSIMAAISIGLILLSNNLDINKSSSLFMIISFSGYFGILAVAGMLFTSHKSAIYTPTRSPILNKTIEFTSSDLSIVQEMVKQENLDSISNLPKKDGTAMILEMVYSKDCKFKAFQYFRYESYKFIPITEVEYIH